MSHTPEPWLLRRYADEIAVYSPNAHTVDKTICQIYHNEGAHPGEPDYQDVVALANAKLILVAPRMARFVLDVRDMAKSVEQEPKKILRAALGNRLLLDEAVAIVKELEQGGAL